MVRPILTGIHQCTCDCLINALLDALDFQVPSMRRLNPTNIKLEISLHESETKRSEIVVMRGCVDVPLWVMTPFRVTQEIGEGRV